MACAPEPDGEPRAPLRDPDQHSRLARCRAALAVAGRPGAKQNARPKTVLRAGFGMFYDRFALANTLAAKRFNGVVQQQYVVTNPDFFPIAMASS